MTLSKRIGSVLREAEIVDCVVTLVEYTGVGHRKSSNRKRSGYIPHVVGKLTTNKVTLHDNATAIKVARQYVNRGRVA